MNKIVHFKNGKFLPTTENWIYNVLVNISRYDSIVYCNGRLNFDSFPFPNVKVFKRYNLPHQITKYNPRLLINLYKDKPVLIHAHFASSGRDFLFYKKFYRAPLVTSGYGIDITASPNRREEITKAYRPLFKTGEVFLAMGEYMKKQFIELGCPENKIIIQHLGIEVDKIPFKQRRFKKNGPVKILIAARFSQKKGIPDALEAIGQLPDNVQVTIIGDSNGSQEDNKEKNRILHVVEKYNLENKIVFLGFVGHDKLIKAFYDHDIFLSPSVTADNGDNEGGYNMSILEASASGMPVVSTLHCDIPDTIVDGTTGFLVPERQPALIAEKITKLIHNPKIWPIMGQNGRDLIEKEYNVAKLIPKLENIYDKTIRQRRR